MAEQDVPAHTPHRSTDLTMIDGPKYLYEGYRFQLRSCSSPDECNINNSWIEIGRTSNFTLAASVLPTSQYSSAPRDTNLIQNLSLGKRVECASNIPGLPVNWLGTGLCLASHRSLTELARPRCLRQQKIQKRKGWHTATSRNLWSLEKMYNTKTFPPVSEKSEEQVSTEKFWKSSRI